MIQPEELRYGCYIIDTWHNNEITKVNERTIEQSVYCPERYDGIPITKELLVDKLNAKDGGGVWYLDFGRFSIAFPSEGAYLCLEGQLGSLPITHIKYLHQLQNLIHSLTGNEMPIKI